MRHPVCGRVYLSTREKPSEKCTAERTGVHDFRAGAPACCYFTVSALLLGYLLATTHFDGISSGSSAGSDFFCCDKAGWQRVDGPHGARLYNGSSVWLVQSLLYVVLVPCASATSRRE